VDVALRVGRNVVAAADLSGQLDAADDLHRLAIDDDDVVAVADVEELLIWIRRERQVTRELRVGLDDLLQELAVRRERLDAAVLPIRDVDGAVLRQTDGVNDAEVLRPISRWKFLRRDDLAMVVVNWLIAERAPHPFELAAVSVEHDDAVVAVAVGNEQ